MKFSTLVLVLVSCLQLTAWADDDNTNSDDADDAVEADADSDAGDDAADKADAADDDDDDAADDDDDDAKRPRAKRSRKSKKAREVDTDDDAAAEVAATATPARDDDAGDLIPPRVSFAGEVLAATPLDSGNRALFGMGGGIGLGAEIYVSPFLGIHAGGAFVYLAKDAGMSSTTWFAGRLGPRVHFGTALFGTYTRKDAWVDANVTYGSSGGIRRPGFDIGASVQWDVSPAVRVGPMVRYQFGSDPRDANAQVFTIGLAIGAGGTTRVARIAPRDADDDGIVDADDACPDEAAGATPDPKRTGCPLVVTDRDDDGIDDDQDQCPTVPAGDNDDPERPGCPFPDRDNDGIMDDADKCPDDPGPGRPLEPTHGCPLARVSDDKIEILQQIFFERGSATLTEDSTAVLEAVAKVLEDKEELRVRIEGHTDETGTAQFNLDLSKRRARAVGQWLVENGGIDPSRLQTEGYGKTRPLVSGSNMDQNRRVEFVIVEATK